MVIIMRKLYLDAFYQNEKILFSIDFIDCIFENSE